MSEVIGKLTSSSATCVEQTVLVKVQVVMSPDATRDGYMSEVTSAVTSSSATFGEQTVLVKKQGVMSSDGTGEG